MCTSARPGGQSELLATLALRTAEALRPHTPRVPDRRSPCADGPVLCHMSVPSTGRAGPSSLPDRSIQRRTERVAGAPPHHDGGQVLTGLMVSIADGARSVAPRCFRDSRRCSGRRQVALPTRVYIAAYSALFDEAFGSTAASAPPPSTRTPIQFDDHPLHQTVLPSRCGQGHDLRKSLPLNRPVTGR